MDQFVQVVHPVQVAILIRKDLQPDTFPTHHRTVAVPMLLLLLHQ
jgi:hypothetical protein